MFEISFPELVILAVIALLVLGPERLPRAAQFIGLWVRKARAQWFAVKSEFERELAAEELKRSLQQAREAVEQANSALRESESQLAESARALQSQASLEDGATDTASLPADESTPPEDAAGDTGASTPGIQQQAGDENEATPAEPDSDRPPTDVR